jgi:hypothetical protein
LSAWNILYSIAIHSAKGMSSSQDELERQPFLHSGLGPVPANRLASHRYDVEEEDHASIELKDIAKTFSLLTALLAILLSLVFFANSVHDSYQGQRHDDTAEEEISRIWRESVVFDPIRVQYIDRSCAPTKVSNLEPKGTKTVSSIQSL